MRQCQGPGCEKRAEFYIRFYDTYVCSDHCHQCLEDATEEERDSLETLKDDEP